MNNIERCGITDVDGYNKAAAEMKAVHDIFRKRSTEELVLLRIKIADSKREARARKILAGIK